MIEAMRGGTPVIAWDCGSVPEVIDEGVSGFVVDNLDDAVLRREVGGRTRPVAPAARRSNRVSA